MNVPRLILAIVAGFIVIFATDYLIHGVWLVPDYSATKSLWQPDAEMNARMTRLGYVFAIVATVALLVLIARYVARVSGWLQ
jgi:hypothetical protein